MTWRAHPGGNGGPASRLLPVVVWSLVVAGLLLAPGDELPDRWDPAGLDKLVHAVLFAAHQALLLWALAGAARRRRAALAAAAVSALYAVVLEVAQRWVPGRAWEWADLAAGLLGIACVALVAARLRARLPAGS